MTCGESGGKTKNGAPCSREVDGRCWQHTETASPFQHIKEPKKRAFLAAFAQTGHVGQATEKAGICPTTPYSAPWKNDAEFQRAWDVARDIAGDVLEAEAVRRAVEGVEEPVGWYQGEPGGTVTRYSDTLLIFLLKGAKHEKYGERWRGELTGKDGEPIKVESIDVSKLKDEELTTLDQLLRRAAVSAN